MLAQLCPCKPDPAEDVAYYFSVGIHISEPYPRLAMPTNVDPGEITWARAALPNDAAIEGAVSYAGQPAKSAGMSFFYSGETNGAAPLYEHVLNAFNNHSRVHDAGYSWFNDYYQGGLDPPFRPVAAFMRSPYGDNLPADSVTDGLQVLSAAWTDADLPDSVRRFFRLRPEIYLESRGDALAGTYLLSPFGSGFTIRVIPERSFAADRMFYWFVDDSDGTFQYLDTAAFLNTQGASPDRATYNSTGFDSITPPDTGFALNTVTGETDSDLTLVAVAEWSSGPSTAVGPHAPTPAIDIQVKQSIGGGHWEVHSQLYAPSAGWGGGKGFTAWFPFLTQIWRSPFHPDRGTLGEWGTGPQYDTRFPSVINCGFF